jgi:hypothetical protein
VNSGSNSGNTIIDDHSNKDDHSSPQSGLFNIRIEGAAPQADPHAAHDSAPHEGAAVHHGGHHPDPTVLALQERLLANGFDPGPLDGVMGPRTEAALAAEQAAYTHLQHGGYGEHEAHHHGGHEGYPHGGYEEHHHGAHEGYGYGHGAHGGYEHEAYSHGGYEDQEYYHTEYVVTEEHGHHHYDEYQAADTEPTGDEAYEMEGAQAAW